MIAWQPIETAPRDGESVLVCLANGAVTIAHWDSQQYNRRPAPYWATERGYLFGVLYDRSNQPTHWMPLPEAPK